MANENDNSWRQSLNGGPGLISIAFGIAFGWGLIQFFKTGSAAAILFFGKWWLITMVALFVGLIIVVIVVALVAILGKLVFGRKNENALTADDLE